MSQNLQPPNWSLPPRISATAKAKKMRGRLASAVAFAGLVLCLVGVLLPRADISAGYDGALDEGFPVTAILVIGAAGLGGLAGVVVSLSGRPLAMTAAVFAAAAISVMTILTYGDVTRLSRESAGLIERGLGLNLLIAGSIVAGLAAIIAVATTAENLDAPTR